jgi:hypothetical protein
LKDRLVLIENGKPQPTVQQAPLAEQAMSE